MPQSCMTHSLWAEEPECLREGLESHRAELERLASQLRAAQEPEERDRLERNIKLLLDEFAPREAEIEKALFLLR